MSTPGPRRNGGLGIAIGAVIGALLLIGWLSADQRTDVPFDPTSTSPTGTRAMVEVIEQYGAQVDQPDHLPDDADVAILFVDVVPVEREEDVHEWVRAGHTLVVADPSSAFTPQASMGSSHASGGISPTIEPGRCTIDALHNLASLHRGAVVGAEALFVDPTLQDVCFANADGAFITLQSEGRGRIVSIASAAPFTNKYLGQADNAVLTVDLLAPRPGTRVAVLGEKAFADSEGGHNELDIMGSLGRLITPGLRLLLLELGVAVLVYGVARGRRLGRPVLEPQPVQIAGSELVAAVGNLLQQTNEPSVAASVVRADLRRGLSDRLGVAPDVAPEVLADIIAARTGRDTRAVLEVVADHPITTDAALVTLTQEIDSIREEVLHGYAP